MALNIPFTRFTLFADPTPADFLAPEAPEGYTAQLRDIVSIGKRAGMVYSTAMPSPFWNDERWLVYVGNLPGQPAWADYWDALDIEIIQQAS